MKKNIKPPHVREMYSVFAEYFHAQADAFEKLKPPPPACKMMLDNCIIDLAGYTDGIAELIAYARAQADHDRLP